MGFGTFDGVHPGHLNYLDQLRELGNEVIIVIARDVSVENIKGRAASLNEVDRLKAVEETGKADLVVLGNEDDFYKVIREHQPNALGLGYDQRANVDMLGELFPETEIVRLHSFEPEKYKSSLLQNSE